MAAANVPKLYRSVIDDVINNVREAFLDEGVDEQILLELKQTWEKKLAETKAMEPKESDLGVSHVAATSGTMTGNKQSTSGHHNYPHHQGTQNHAAVSVTQHNHQQQQTQHPNHQVLSIQNTISNQGRPVMAHQLNPSSNLVQQALLQYAASSGTGESSDGSKTVTLTVPQKVTITLPAQLTHQGSLQNVMSAPATAATLALPPEVTASLLQQAALSQGGMLNHTRTVHAAVGDHGSGVQYQTVAVNQQGNHSQSGGIIQLDGANDTSDDDDDEDFPDNDDDRDDDEQNENEDDFLGEEEMIDPLNSEDDVSDDDPSELFETDNVVVCQYDKITRSRNRWKFHLKDGIMNLQGKDYVFQKAVGDAEW